MSGQLISAADGVPAPDRSPDSDHPRGGEAAWIRIGALAAFGAGPIFPVTVGGQRLLIVKDGGRVFALERACPHEGADLAKGRCVAGRLHCPHHQASFALADGAVSPGWSFRRLCTYPIRIVDGDIYIDTTDLISGRCGAQSKSGAGSGTE
jgi:nitrite reductase/ring-hydroxylating ferredoxin subunit